VNEDTGGSVIDASNNWWGRSSGPSDWGTGVGSSTSAEVDFFPWALHPNFGAFQPCTMTGTPGIDALTGTPGKDVICGLGGDDTLNGLGGRDLLLGGDGNDILHGGSANDALIGGNQDDGLLGQQGLDDTGQGRAGSDMCDATTERTSTCP
jgi:Ca2+-binding RTX toxin-like protein